MIMTALIIGSYILGCVPFGLLIVKAWCGIDIRNYGSGNIGATNVMRTAGKGAAVTVFFADVLKGYLPVLAAHRLFPGVAWLAIGCGMMAMLGHMFSIFLKFRGGKGAATGCGIFLGLSPIVGSLALAIWIATIAIFRLVSLASILGAASIPIMMFIFPQPLSYQIFGIFAACFVIVKHRSNIVRLIQGKEPKWGNKVSVSEDVHAE